MTHTTGRPVLMAPNLWLSVIGSHFSGLVRLAFFRRANMALGGCCVVSWLATQGLTSSLEFGTISFRFLSRQIAFCVLYCLSISWLPKLSEEVYFSGQESPSWHRGVQNMR